jgi:hypothetical protein
VLDSAGAVKAPFVFGDGLGESLLESAGGGESFNDGLAVFLEDVVLFRGEEVDLASEAVFVGVETGTLLAGLGLGPVGPVGWMGNWESNLAIASAVACFISNFIW